MYIPALMTTDKIVAANNQGFMPRRFDRLERLERCAFDCREGLTEPIEIGVRSIFPVLAALFVASSTDWASKFRATTLDTTSASIVANLATLARSVPVEQRSNNFPEIFKFASI